MIASGSSIVDWTALGKVVLYSLVAGVGVSLAFGITIRGSVRFAELRRERAAAPRPAAYVTVALLGLAVSAAAVAYGIVLMTKK